MFILGDDNGGDGNVVRTTTRRLPVRLKATMPDGVVVPIPIDTSRPHAMTIIAALQLVVDTWGRTPLLRETTITTLHSRADNDRRSHVRSVSTWVKEKMRYLADPDGGEYVQSPAVLLRRIREAGFAYGDCDDHVVLLGAMLTSIGIRARVAGVILGGGALFNHVVIEWQDGHEWTVVDPCAKTAAPPFYGQRLTTG
jgi:hypothetical protein